MAPPFRPVDLRSIHFEFSPLVTVYERGIELRRHLNHDKLRPLVDQASSCKELTELIIAEIKAFGPGFPIRVVCMDGADGVETDLEWATIPVIMFAPYQPDGDFLATLQ